MTKRKQIYCYKKLWIISLLLFTISVNNCFSQNLADSIRQNSHSPRKATIYSAILPGLGQIYNQQYWKVPVLYAGIATIAYFINFNHNKYNTFRTEYLARINKDTLAIDPKYELYSDNSIYQLKNYYQRNLEFTYIIAGVVYILNLLDASVYAHLFTFDVSNNLSFRAEPVFNNNIFLSNLPVSGIKLTLNF